MRLIKPENLKDLTLKKAIKKPIPVRCVQVHEPFEVETMEGTLRGKKDDWLMIGIDGEMYPCDNKIFLKTYDLID